MEILKWLFALVAIALGILGLGMSLCGGWFFLAEIFNSGNDIDAFTTVIAIGSLLIGVGLLFGAWKIIKKLNDSESH